MASEEDELPIAFTENNEYFQMVERVKPLIREKLNNDTDFVIKSFIKHITAKLKNMKPYQDINLETNEKTVFIINFLKHYLIFWIKYTWVI